MPLLALALLAVRLVTLDQAVHHALLAAGRMPVQHNVHYAHLASAARSRLLDLPLATLYLQPQQRPLFQGALPFPSTHFITIIITVDCSLLTVHC